VFNFTHLRTEITPPYWRCFLFKNILHKKIKLVMIVAIYKGKVFSEDEI